MARNVGMASLSSIGKLGIVLHLQLIDNVPDPYTDENLY